MKKENYNNRELQKSIVIGLSLILIVFVFDQEAFAYSETKIHSEYLDFQPYTGNRLITFNDTRIDYCITDNNENPVFNLIATNAIKTWHKRITEVTNNTSVWDMTMHVHPQNETICDGYVNYYDTPNPSAFQIAGVAGFSHPLTPVANVTIYTKDYQTTLRNLEKNDENFWETLTLEKFQDIIKNGNHKHFDYETIYRITMHEIGHSLSLNHPITSDGDLVAAPGIMGYNMSENKILDEEVVKIVKAYPNGFSKISSPESINLEDPNTKKTVYLGEVTNLTIELPNHSDNLAPTGIELYIFPEGTTAQKPESAPIKILKTIGNSQLVNDEKYIQDLRVSMTHWDTFTKVLSIQFKVIKEFENADMIIVSHSVGGFEKQWFLDDVLSVEKALFSNLLLDLETTDYKYHLMSDNPNRAIEKENAFKLEQKQLYNKALSDCLQTKNMKKCTEEIKLEDFDSVKDPVKIWMPITVLYK